VSLASVAASPLAQGNSNHPLAGHSISFSVESEEGDHARSSQTFEGDSGSLAHHRSSLLSLSLSAWGLGIIWSVLETDLAPLGGQQRDLPSRRLQLDLGGPGGVQLACRGRDCCWWWCCHRCHWPKGGTIRVELGGGSWSSAGIPLDGSEELLSWEGKRAGPSLVSRSLRWPSSVPPLPLSISKYQALQLL
jgi:hypothetical protein